jgi:hypothetical protein
MYLYMYYLLQHPTSGSVAVYFPECCKDFVFYSTYGSTLQELIWMGEELKGGGILKRYVGDWRLQWILLMTI